MTKTLVAAATPVVDIANLPSSNYYVYFLISGNAIAHTDCAINNGKKLITNDNTTLDDNGLIITIIPHTTFNELLI
ncbi:MAG: hypothetical protein V7K18_01525 [Nostoc sp.]|uniref:hypothetical protein n=1 Tax=Nostoc sp. TaxID=1180 RepID=UPI002FFCFFD0